MLSRILIIFSIILFSAAVSVYSQPMTLLPGAGITIKGTSNIHDWEATATRTEARFELAGAGQVSLNSLAPDMFRMLQLTIPVKDLDTDKRGLTKNIHKYLDESNHPNITFTLTEIAAIEQQTGTAKISVKGTIRAAGRDRNIEIDVNAEELNGIFRFSGSQDLKMTDFGIDPPTALLGTIRAKDDITVYFDLSFKK